MRYIKSILIAVLVVPLGFPLAFPLAFADAELEQRLSKTVSELLPGMKVTAISKSPVEGLYEVVTGAHVFYITEDGRYVLRGDLMDLNEKKNISDIRRNDARANLLKATPASDTIEFAPENSKHVVYVFTDIDCTYCRRFHKEVDKLNEASISVRYFAFPRAGPGSPSFKNTISVWCAKDNKKALTEAKLGKSVRAEECDNPVNKLYELGKEIGVRGTPAVYTEDGTELGGYIPADQLISYLKSAK